MYRGKEKYILKLENNNTLPLKKMKLLPSADMFHFQKPYSSPTGETISFALR